MQVSYKKNRSSFSRVVFSLCVRACVRACVRVCVVVIERDVRVEIPRGVH